MERNPRQFALLFCKTAQLGENWRSHRKKMCLGFHALVEHEHPVKPHLGLKAFRRAVESGSRSNRTGNSRAVVSIT
jgi:hypothetical protein